MADFWIWGWSDHALPLEWFTIRPVVSVLHMEDGSIKIVKPPPLALPKPRDVFPRAAMRNHGLKLP